MKLRTAVFVQLDRWLARCQPRSFKIRQLRAREKYRPDYEIVAASLLRLVSFKSVLDVGCANGFLLEAFQRAGKEVAGLDRAGDILQVMAEPLRGRVQVADFAEVHGQYDFVCCVEMAEHIPPERSVQLVEKLCGLARHCIYFTAARPGQIGLGHVNSRPHEDWLTWFKDQQWVANLALTEALRKDIASLRKTFWLRRNSFLLTPAATLGLGSAVPAVQSPRREKASTGRGDQYHA